MTKYPRLYAAMPLVLSLVPAVIGIMNAYTMPMIHAVFRGN